MHSWFDILQDKGDSPYFTTDEKTQFLNRAQTKFVNETLNRFFYATGAQPEKNATPYNSIESIQAAEEVLAPLIGSLETNNSWVYDATAINGKPGLGHDGAYTPIFSDRGRLYQHQLDHYVQGMYRDRNSAQYNASTWQETYMMAILSVNWANNGEEVLHRYVRKQDHRKILRNAFKKPTTQDPIYFIERNTQTGNINWRILPPSRPNIYAGTSGQDLYGLWRTNAGVLYDFTDIPAANLNAVRARVEVIRSPLPMFYDPQTFVPYPVAANSNVSCILPDFTHDEIMAIALDDAGIASRDTALVQLNQAGKANITPQ